MINGKRNKKDFSSIAYETYKDFAENTSIHGLKHTVKDNVTVYENLVVLAGLCGSGYMTLLFWNRYTSNPTRTSILTAYAPNTAVPFPAVTLCNINRIMMDRVDEFMETLNIRDEDVETVRRAFPQLLAFVSIDARDYNMSELSVLHTVLVENNYLDVATVMKNISQPCEKMLLKCMWKYKVVPCDELFDDTYTTDGPCCSFNYIREYIDASRNPMYTPFNGFHGGLKLHIDPQIQEVQYSSLHSAGLKVLIHSPWDYPGSGAIYKIISAGRQSFLQVTASKIICSEDIKKLSIAQRQCAYSEEINLKYFRLYSVTNCLTECEEKYLYSRCGCVPFYYPFSTKRICNITSIPCLDESIGTSLVNITRTCSCPSQCEDMFYSVSSATASMDKEKTAFSTSSFLYNLFLTKTLKEIHFRLDQNLTEDSIILYVYFSGDRQIILYKDIVTSTIYLLSSFGGVYSLFLGCSFVTIVEILYYCTFRLMVNSKLIAKIDKTVQKPKREEQNQEKLWTYEGSIFLN